MRSFSVVIHLQVTMREVLEQEAEMFKIGDYVAHYKEGVCEVVNIGKIDMGSSDKEYYTLKPVYDAGGTVYTPVDNSGIRSEN